MLIRFLKICGVVVIAIAIVSLWIACPVFVIHYYGYPSEPGGFGDIFGAINALFAGMAFFGIIITILLQRKELHQNTAELRNSAQALSEQVMLMRLSAKLSALPELIRQEKLKIWTLDKEKFKDSPNEAFTSEHIDGLISLNNTNLAQNKSRIVEIEAELAQLNPEDFKDHPARMLGVNTPYDSLKGQRESCRKAILIGNAVIAALKRLQRYIEDLDAVYFEIDARSVAPTNIKIPEGH